MSIFKTHKENIPQIHAVIDTFKECYFHGCGNMYDNKVDSDFRKDFSNPGHNNTAPASAYRVHFTDKSEVPDTVEKLNALLQGSFAKEQVEASKPKSVANVKTISVKPVAKSQVELDEEELQRQIDAEATTKATAENIPESKKIVPKK
jgi:hypothetical protein